MFTCRAGQESDLKSKVAKKMHAIPGKDVFLCVHIHVHICVCQKTTSTIIPQVLPILVSCLHWHGACKVDLAHPSEPQKSASLLPQSCSNRGATVSRPTPFLRRGVYGSLSMLGPASGASERKCHCRGGL